jgi:hypothetical protein
MSLIRHWFVVAAPLLWLSSVIVWLCGVIFAGFALRQLNQEASRARWPSRLGAFTFEPAAFTPRGREYRRYSIRCMLWFLILLVSAMLVKGVTLLVDGSS